MAPYRRYKGVVPRHSGRWSCRIYAHGQCVWLGTFKSKEDAAMAYQSVASKLQVSEALRNFPSSEAIADELKFQSFCSTEKVPNMIKDGSYPSSFAYYLKTLSQSSSSNKGMISQLMFPKELTPSDVGRTSILVIPKKSATKSFHRFRWRPWKMWLLRGCSYISTTGPRSCGSFGIPIDGLTKVMHSLPAGNVS